MKRFGKWLWGLVLVALGVILALNALEITDINIFFPGWWTLFIIVPCAVSLLTGDKEDKPGAALGLMIGALLLLGALIDFSIVWKLFIPAVLLFVGITMIWGSVTGDKFIRVTVKPDHKHKERETRKVREGEVVSEEKDAAETKKKEQKSEAKARGDDAKNAKA